jgi:hypothetical protein
VGRVLFVSDLDGTLLRPDATLGARTVRAVNTFVSNGGLFTYATARSFTSAAPITAPLDLRLPVITYGGAVVVDPVTRRPRQARLLPARSVERILSVAAVVQFVEPILFVVHEGRDRVCWLADRCTPWMDGFLAKRRGDPRLFPLREWAQVDMSSIFDVTLISARAPLVELRDALVDVASECHVVFSEEIYVPDEWWLTFTSPEATKAAAVRSVQTEVAAERLVCCGDNQNDLPMFAVADVALAVANALPEIREVATEIIGGNESEGVAGWLERHGAGLLAASD